jgi:hypothetical protein
MSLLNRIVKSSIAENATNRKLHDMSYSAINGDRQEPQQQPEGVVMLGQLSREKPMTAITKEMIQEYQQRENELNTAPNVINGVPMKYKPVGYDLTLKPSISISGLVSDTQELIGDRVYVSGDIQRLGQAIKETSDNIKKIKNDIDEKGSNYGNLQVLYKEVSKLETLEKQLKEKNKLYDYIENTLKANEIKKKDIDRENAITAQDNQAKLSVYERELNQANRNRLNLQQQPNESEAEYYQRLKELQTEKYDPILYRQRAITQNTTELKEKLGDLFKDTSFKEDILKTLSDEDKFLLNKYFDKIGKSFLDQYGFNNKTLNSKMASKELADRVKLLHGNALTTLQSAFKRTKQGEVYRDAILLEREQAQSRARRAEEDLIRDRFRRAEEQGRRRDERIQRRELLDRTLSQGQEQFQALKTLQGALRRGKEQSIYERQRGASTALQGALRQQQERNLYGGQKQASTALQSALRQGQAQAQFGRQKGAITALQSALRREQLQDRYKNEILDERDRLDFELAKNEELARRGLEARATKIQSAYRGLLGQREARRIRQNKKQQEVAQRYSPSSVLSTSAERLSREPEEVPKFILDQQKRNEEQASRYTKYSSVYQPSANITTRLNRPSILEKTAAKNIQRVFRGRLGRQEYEKEQEKVARVKLIEAFKPSPSVEPKGDVSRGDTELSNLTTPDFSRTQSEVGGVGKIRKTRSDKGQSRDEYNYDPSRPVGRPRKPRNPVGRPRKIVEENLQGAKGNGIGKKIYKRKPQINKDEKMKNRLRLVASQIEAGNTNPRLIGEVNALYKKLYNVDNAYMYLNKNKK